MIIKHFMNLMSKCQNPTASAEKISYIQNGSRPVSNEKMRDKRTIKGRNHILIKNGEILENLPV